MQEYIILAHSASTNQTQRELQLEAAQPTTRELATRLADIFAKKLQKSTGVLDWQGAIELVDADYHVRTL
jgi:hypothetical protein